MNYNDRILCRVNICIIFLRNYSKFTLSLNLIRNKETDLIYLLLFIQY